ncbi:MAG: hypothetical protein M3O93_01225 [Chloroflexota bacterium]|nr:hypothetical protein [Chloroflexota bacterium]
MPDTLLGLVLTRLDQVEDPVLLHREAAAYPTEEFEALLSAGIVKETSRALQVPRSAHMPAGGDLLVRETAKGLFGVATEDDYHQPVPLAEDDVRQYEIVVSKLVDLLRQENELEGVPVPNGRRLTLVGERPLPGGLRADVYLSLLNDDQSEFMLVCRHVHPTNPRPVVMLVPSSVPLSVENAQLLRSWDMFVSPLTTYLNGARWNLPWDRILTKAADLETKLPRRRGRPKGTRSVTRAEIVGKFRALRENYGRNPTQAELAANLTPRIEVRTLNDHLTDYGLGWPIE